MVFYILPDSFLKVILNGDNRCIYTYIIIPVFSISSPCVQFCFLFFGILICVYCFSLNFEKLIMRLNSYFQGFDPCVGQ